MAHLVVKPTKISIRQYYFQIIKLYYKITMPLPNVIYMFKKYGVKTTFKLSAGALKITFQYINKILRG
jgi:hypothetical protein